MNERNRADEDGQFGSKPIADSRRTGSREVKDASHSPKRVAVIGGGVAGLSCAWFLNQAGIDATVFESSSAPGGLASTFEIEPGVWLERFYHFICQPDEDLKRMVERLGLSHRLRWRETRMALFHGEHLHPFGSPLELLRFQPLKPIDRLRVGLHVLKSRRLKDWHSLDALTASDWLRQELGEDAYRVIWEPLLTMKFGEEHRQISAAWIWSRIARVARSRKGIFGKEQLGYLEGGTQLLLTTLAEQMPGKVRLNAPVEQVLMKAGQVLGLKVGGQDLPFDAVVSTVPLRLLARLAPELPDAYRQQLLNVDYIGVTCLLLKLKRSFSPYFWTNVSDESIPFAGCIEYTRLNPMASLKQSTLLYVPHYLSSSEERYGWDLDTTLKHYLPALKRINPDFRAADIAEAYLNKAPYAQVLCRKGFAGLVPPFHAPVEGLYLTDSTQLYPEDRVISDLIRCAERVSELVRGYVAG